MGPFSFSCLDGTRFPGASGGPYLFPLRRLDQGTWERLRVGPVPLSGPQTYAHGGRPSAALDTNTRHPNPLKMAKMFKKSGPHLVPIWRQRRRKNLF